MITHDVDEAIFLADRILLMTNGPFAHVAENVEITIPRPRDRAEIVAHPNYYQIRNHLVHFLARRSKELGGRKVADPQHRPRMIRFAAGVEEASAPRPRAGLYAVHS
jgi:nitrate/nitrite transport system ATP-binding protein